MTTKAIHPTIYMIIAAQPAGTQTSITAPHAKAKHATANTGATETSITAPHAKAKHATANTGATEAGLVFRHLFLFLLFFLLEVWLHDRLLEVFQIDH